MSGVPFVAISSNGTIPPNDPTVPGGCPRGSRTATQLARSERFDGNIVDLIVALTLLILIVSLGILEHMALHERN